MYAIIATGGKQYRVSEGDVIYIEKIDAQVDSTVSFDVLLMGNDGDVKIGTPVVEGVKVEGKVVGQTESTIKTITAPLSIRSSQDFANRLLELNQQTTTHKTSERATAYGENTSGGFDGAYTQDKSETVTGSGTGKGHYTTFTEVLKKLFSGKGKEVSVLTYVISILFLIKFFAVV